MIYEMQMFNDGGIYLNKPKMRLGLIYGGRSGEHQVSLLTALAVIQALDYHKYEVIPFYITKTGEWRSGHKLFGPVATVDELTFSEEHLTTTWHLQSSSQVNFPTLTRAHLDVVFPLLHGTFGEDGTIQGLFEMADLPYVGSGVLASALGMDKVMMKKVFAQAGLPQCLFRYFTRKDWELHQADYLLDIETAIGYPCFVKPANLGSSVGISKVQHREQLIKAIQFAFQYDRKVLIEEYISAREIEVSVIGNESPSASVPGEIISSNEFYDYHAKYIDGKSQMLIPAPLSDDLVETFREMAIRAFQAIDGNGLSRVDFFLEKSSQRILINEINTMPGFTPFSMYPLLWKASGKSYQALLDELIQLALARFEDRQQIQYTFEL
jgi:D-alanine-D-alanine ligase